MSDAELVDRIRGGDIELFETLMRRHNRRVYRAVRAVLDDEADVEDAMQQAYVSAFTHLHQFEHRSAFSTWLIRIALREAFARRRKALTRLDVPHLGSADNGGPAMDTIPAPQPDPERHAYAQELRRVLEAAVERLPEPYRLVFMMRDVEGLSTRDAGDALGLGEEAVKTRLHRARAMIRGAVTAQIGAVAPGAFEFPAERCDRVVAGAMVRIRRA